MKNILTTALLISGFSLAMNSNAEAGDHIDDLAFSIQKQAQVLNHEFARNYRHTPSYRHLMSDTSQMYRLAAHIHDLAHHGGSVRHMEADVRQLDRLFHHIEDLVNAMSHRGHGHGHGHLQPLHGGHHGHGHHGFRGPDTRRARMLLRSMENTIHHLHSDLQRLIRIGHGQPIYQPVQPLPGPIYQPGLYGGYPKQGVALPRKNVRVQFGNGGIYVGVQRQR